MDTKWQAGFHPAVWGVSRQPRGYPASREDNVLVFLFILSFRVSANKDVFVCAQQLFRLGCTIPRLALFVAKKIFSSKQYFTN